MNNNKNKFLKMLAFIAAAGTVAVTAAGCGNTQTSTDNNSLTYWVRLHPNIGTSVTNLGETPFAKAYSEKTGINVTYIHPAQGQEEEALNILLAAGDLPDIIETDWLSREPESSIANKTIIALNDLVDKGAPNLKKYLQENPQIDKEIKTDSGKYYVFPFIRNSDKLLSTSGFMLRGDWLEDLNLEAPQTMDEWEKVLTAFKEKKGAASPVVGGVYHLRCFAGAYNVGYDFYVDDGKVKYGCIEDGFGEFLKTMNRWYENGLIDKNFSLMDNDYITSSIIGGKSGASFGAGGGALGVWSNTAKNNGDTKYKLIAAEFPTTQKGTKPEFGNKQLPYSPLNGAAITGNCKNPELAAKFLDYSYSEEGSMLNNFGIEGESYEMVDGQPKYTELITNNPDKLPMAQILTMYVRASIEGPFIQDERYIEQYYQLDTQRDALVKWSNNNHQNHIMPQVTLSEEELSEYNRIMTDFTTYRDENINAFIIGSRPISEFGNFVNECKSKNIEKAIAIYQQAYDRFVNR